MVTLYVGPVGPDKTVFHVHQNLLFDASPVFKAGFSGDFKEAAERSMSLPDDDKHTLGRMIHWLYTRKLDLTVPIDSKTSNECYMQLAKLNTLADKYDIYLLKNDIVDELFELKKLPKPVKPPQIPIIKYVYDNTTGTSSFRKLMVAWYAYLIDFKWYDFEGAKDVLAGVSPEFAIDLAIAFGARQQHPDRKSPFALPSSTFHETSPEATRSTTNGDKDSVTTAPTPTCSSSIIEGGST